MDTCAIEWLPSDVQQDVFFTREAFEKYSLRNRLEEVILEKEKELFPDGRKFSKPTAQLEKHQESIGGRISPEHDVEDGEQVDNIHNNTNPDGKREFQVEGPVSRKMCGPSMETSETVNESEGKKEESDLTDVSAGHGKSHIWVLPKNESEETVLTKPQVKMLINERPGGWYAKLLYPRPSWLTMEEQSLYVNFLSRKQKEKQNPTDAKEIHAIKEIEQKVLKEQEEFHAYSEESAIAYPEAYQVMDQQAEEFIDEYISSLCKRASNYPRYFVQQDSVPINPKVAGFVPFLHVKCLLKLGDVPKAIIPNIETISRPRIPTDKGRISERYPTSHDVNKRPTCSADNNMEKLAIKYAAEVTISAAGLKCLLDHGSNFERQWELPVVVKEHVIKDTRGERRHKVVYIDKPFPQRFMLASTKNAWFYKFATKFLVLHPQHRSGRAFSFHRRDKTSPSGPIEDEEPFSDLADLETFGTSSSAFKKYVREPKKELHLKLSVEDEHKERTDGSDTEAVKGVVLHRSGSEGFSVNQGTTNNDLLSAVLSPVHSPQSDTKKKTNPLRASVDAPINTGRTIGSKPMVVGKENSDAGMDGSGVLEPISDIEGVKKSTSDHNGDDKNSSKSVKSQSQLDDHGILGDVKNTTNSTTNEPNSPEGLLELSTDDEGLQIDLGDKEGVKTNLNVDKISCTEPSRRRTRSSSNHSTELEEGKAGNSTSSRRMTRNRAANMKPQSRCPTDEDSGSEGMVIDVSACDGSQRMRTRSLSKSESEPEALPTPKRGRGRPRKIKIEQGISPLEGNNENPVPKKTIRRSSEPEEHVLGKRRSARLASHGTEVVSGNEGTETKRKRSEDTPMSPGIDDVIRSPNSGIASPVVSLASPTIFSYEESQVGPQSETRLGFTGPKIIPLSPIYRSKDSETGDQVALNNAPSTKDVVHLASAEQSDAKVSEKKEVQTATKSEGVTAKAHDKPTSAFDQILAAQEQFLAPQVTAVVKDEQPQVPESASLPEKPAFLKSDPNEWVPSEDAQQYVIYDQPNLTYNLWLLGSTRLLIRCGIHGVHKPSKKKVTNDISLSAKMEHQPFFGIEQATYSDCARAWVDAYIRNVQKVARVRINALNSEIPFIEHLGIGDIINAKSPFNPLSAMSMVNGVFEKLKSLPQGHYLLGHSPGNQHAHIKKSVSTTRGVYDLHKAYLDRKVGIIKNERIPWVPIDTSTLLYYHKKHNRVPGTFEPKDSRNVGSLTAGYGANKPHKKRNKNKKKKHKK